MKNLPWTCFCCLIFSLSQHLSHSQHKHSQQHLHQCFHIYRTGEQPVVAGEGSTPSLGLDTSWGRPSSSSLSTGMAKILSTSPTILTSWPAWDSRGGMRENIQSLRSNISWRRPSSPPLARGVHRILLVLVGIERSYFKLLDEKH